MYDAWALSRETYAVFVPDSEKADNCTECGECLEKCPQQIEIPGWLATAHSKISQQ